MRNYIATAVLALQAGIRVGLTKEQAAARGHALKPVAPDKKAGGGVYEVLSPIQFKVGERFTTDADIGKQFADYVETAEAAAAREKEEAARAAAAADMDATRAKAQKWDEVQDELTASREFITAIQALPKELLDKVKAAIEPKKS